LTALGKEGRPVLSHCASRRVREMFISEACVRFVMQEDLDAFALKQGASRQCGWRRCISAKSTEESFQQMKF
jgi:hypothetical protein